MRKIIICTENDSALLEKMCREVTDAQLIVKKPEDLENYESENADIIITDISLNKLDKCSQVIKFSLPVLAITERIPVGIQVRSEGFDYIVSPLNEYEFGVRLRNMLKIKSLKDKITDISTIDDLTGLHNRKFLSERIESEMARAKRYKLSMSCALFDIDFFKTVNDMYGYECGDTLLKKIAEVLNNLARKEDIVTRYGDEEFLVLLPDTSEANAFIFAERFRRDIEKMIFIPEGDDEAHPVRISGGVAQYPYMGDYDENTDTVIRYAEHALYNAKNHGKNKVVKFSQVNMDF